MDKIFTIQFMSPPESTPNTTEQASWLNEPVPSIFTSIRNRIKVRTGALYDGACLGFYGDSILVPIHDEHPPFKRIDPVRNQIVAFNPGTSRVSKLLPIVQKGTFLALAHGKDSIKLSHCEAESDNLLREVPYTQIFRYMGFDKKTLRLATIYCQAFLAETTTEWQAPFQLAYQVTKKWERSGLTLVNEKQKTDWRPPFIDGGGLFGSRRRITSH